MKYWICVIWLLFSINGFSQSQKKYWIYIKPEVSKIQFINEFPEFKQCFHSNWLHAFINELSDQDLPEIKGSGFVSAITETGFLIPTGNSVRANKLGFALEQINGQAFIEAGLNGKGVKVGIIDGGFLAADKHPSLITYFQDSLVIEYKDYLTPNEAPYTGNQYLDDQHGTDVWEMLGGVNRDKNVQLGLATHASIYLARTDHGGSERRIEEEYFVQALEWLDSLGVKLVNASVGYTYGYNNPDENYSPSQMDGSSAIAKAVQYASEEKGMLIVVAAGNEGDVAKWKILNTPADAEDVLAVGASKLNITDRMNYSSIGPEFLSYMKPDITCFASRGTSFSTPILTGMAAGIWQHDSTLSNLEVKEIITQSGNLYPYGNNHVGYGVPDCERILSRLKTGTFRPNPIQIVTPESNKVKLNVESGEYIIVAYHKINDWYVVNKELFEFKGETIRIRRFPKCESTTVVAGDNIWEVMWQ